jgi:hypothetical protein
MGRMLSIDETAPSQVELYTIVSNKESHNGKGTIVAIVRGTKRRMSSQYWRRYRNGRGTRWTR